MARGLLGLRPLLLASLRPPTSTTRAAGKGGLIVAASPDSPYAEAPPCPEVKSGLRCRPGIQKPTPAVFGALEHVCSRSSGWLLLRAVSLRLGCPISGDCHPSPFPGPAVFLAGGRNDRLMAVCTGPHRVP